MYSSYDAPEAAPKRRKLRTLKTERQGLQRLTGKHRTQQQELEDRYDARSEIPEPECEGLYRP